MGRCSYIFGLIMYSISINIQSNIVHIWMMTFENCIEMLCEIKFWSFKWCLALKCWVCSIVYFKPSSSLDLSFSPLLCYSLWYCNSLVFWQDLKPENHFEPSACVFAVLCVCVTLGMCTVLCLEELDPLHTGFSRALLLTLYSCCLSEVSITDWLTHTGIFRPKT